MRKINATFDVENDLAEYNLWKTLEAMGGKHLRILPDTEHLKDDKRLKALSKAEKKAKNAKYEYINNNMQ